MLTPSSPRVKFVPSRMILWGAHAPRVCCSVPSPSRQGPRTEQEQARSLRGCERIGEAPIEARAARVLPGLNPVRG